jgi:hypothetical protein
MQMQMNVAIHEMMHAAWHNSAWGGGESPFIDFLLPGGQAVSNIWIQEKCGLNFR